MKIVIINYGAGNIQSIMFAIERLGYKAVLSNNPDEIKAADKVIFPGVGEASYAMKMLKESGLDVLIPTLKQPVFGICLGMQLMCNHSEEGDTKGLGIFDVDVVKFSSKVKVIPPKRKNSNSFYRNCGPKPCRPKDLFREKPCNLLKIPRSI